MNPSSAQPSSLTLSACALQVFHAKLQRPSHVVTAQFGNEFQITYAGAKILQKFSRVIGQPADYTHLVCESCKILLPTQQYESTDEKFNFVCLAKNGELGNNSFCNLQVEDHKFLRLETNELLIICRFQSILKKLEMEIYLTVRNFCDSQNLFSIADNFLCAWASWGKSNF